MLNTSSNELPGVEVVKFCGDVCPEIRTHSGTVPGTFRNTNVENQGTNEDGSQSDPQPEAGHFRSQTTQNSVPEVARDSVH